MLAGRAAKLRWKGVKHKTSWTPNTRTGLKSWTCLSSANEETQPSQTHIYECCIQFSGFCMYCVVLNTNAQCCEQFNLVLCENCTKENTQTRSLRKNEPNKNDNTHLNETCTKANTTKVHLLFNVYPSNNTEAKAPLIHTHTRARDVCIVIKS